MSSQNRILTEEEEYEHFLQFYKAFSTCLPQLELGRKEIEAIAKDAVFNYNKYRFFEDVRRVIPELSKFYKLAVVSDAWPSLENVYKQAGLRDYFSSFIISSKLGITKPNPLMYKSALEELDVLPEEAVFIDDSIKNCDGAMDLGLSSFVLCRDWKLFMSYKILKRSHTILRNLEDFKNKIENGGEKRYEYYPRKSS